MDRVQTDVIIIGGGATGAGVLRDCALRGISAVLIEKNDIASGTTGRNHGLLHSGARYAVKDTESASECIRENEILKRIARHCVEDTGGLFVTLPEDDPGHHDKLVQGCRSAGIACEELDPAQALSIEPHLNPSLTRALKVPDATVDPFRLTAANVLCAMEHGARVFTHAEVVDLILDKDRAVGARCAGKGGLFEVYGKVVVNASGVYGQHVCSLAGVTLLMFPSKGSMVISDYRVNGMVVNRCRPNADGDIVVPGDTVSLIGTTSKKNPYDEISELDVEDDEIEVLLADGEKLIPNVSKTRILRAYCGVRPLVAAGKEVDGREISRGIVLVDHKKRDGLEGLVTIAGGKLTTYRLMAQMATDLACAKLGMQRECRTHCEPLPGSEEPVPKRKMAREFSGIPHSVVGSTLYRHGQRVRRILSAKKQNYGLVCECEMVTQGEVEYALSHLLAADLVDLRRRTRLGMGPCQGALCAYRAAGILAGQDGADGAEAARMLVAFIEERYKGVKPVLWGDALREMEFSYWIYEGLFGLSHVK